MEFLITISLLSEDKSVLVQGTLSSLRTVSDRDRYTDKPRIPEANALEKPIYTSALILSISTNGFRSFSTDLPSSAIFLPRYKAPSQWDACHSAFVHSVNSMAISKPRYHG